MPDSITNDRVPLISYLGKTFQVLISKEVSLESGLTVLQPGVTVRVDQGLLPMVQSLDVEEYFEEIRNNTLLRLAIGYEMGPKGLVEMIHENPAGRSRLMDFRYHVFSPTFCMSGENRMSDGVKDSLGYVLDHDDRFIVSVATPSGFIGFNGDLKDLVVQSLGHDVLVGASFHNNAVGVLGDAVYRQSKESIDKCLFDWFESWFKDEQWPLMRSRVKEAIHQLYPSGLATQRELN